MRNLLLIFAICSIQICFAQRNDLPKFGQIDPTVFDSTAYAVDSSAPAVMLFDFGRTNIVGNSKGWFSMRHVHRRRIHILSKDGYDYASDVINLYQDNDGATKLESIRCVTYNKEGGVVQTTKLENSQVFTEQVDKYRSRVRFTAPSVKVGSVVEYEYTTLSDFFFSLVPWNFQGAIPRLWSEYQFSLPQFMDYLYFAQGYVPFFMKEKKERLDFFAVNTSDMESKRYSFRGNVTEYRWAMKNVPVLKEENFTSTLNNHIARLEFQLAGYKDPLNPVSILNDWPKVVSGLMEREDFGKLVNANNGWLDDVVKPIIAGFDKPEDAARRIYAHVRDNYTCTDNRSLFAEQTLRNVVRNAKGNVCELNLLLVSMLRRAGLKVYPMILSTRENGTPNVLYPQLNRYNYVVAALELEGKQVLLDASGKHLVFGMLPPYCYNGAARMLDEVASPTELITDSLLERKTTLLNLQYTEGKWGGTLRQMPGYFQAVQIRDQADSKGKGELEQKFKASLGSMATVDSFTVEGLSDLNANLVYSCAFNMNMNGEDIIYLNPLMEELYTENPFKSAMRAYPVEMPFKQERNYVASIVVPDGYKLDEVPKSIRMAMNEERDATFDYLVAVNGTTINLRTVLRINRTWFAPEEYEMLREFFNHVVAKQSEQLVFKKQAK